MNVWSHLSTIFKQRYSPLTVGIAALCVAFITTLLFVVSSSSAATGTNQTVSFQGRLLNSTGGVVPDGYYNMQFKLYQDGTGTAAGNPGGTLKWTESYVNNGGTSGVQVKNGFFSVTLGSRTAFGSSVDWNQDTLWLSMNIAGSAAACTTFGTAPCGADGEMLPMKRMTATPYAMNAGRLGGLDASGFIQNTNTQQTGDFNISGTGKANSIQGNTNVLAPLFDRADTGTLSIGTTNATTINIGSNNADHAINIGTGIGNQEVSIGSLTGTSTTKIYGGSGGTLIKNTAGGLSVEDVFGNRQLTINNNGAKFNLRTDDQFTVADLQSGGNLFTIDQDHNITASWDTIFNVDGNANFARGIRITSANNNFYTTPLGYNMQTAINVVNYDVAEYNSVMVLGVTAGSGATARGIAVADARTGAHQPTIGVFSPDENQIAGFSWDGSTTNAYFKTTSSTIGIRTNGNTDVATFTNTGISLLQPTTVTSNFSVTGNSAYTQGTDFSSTGTINNANFGTGTLFRITGTGAKTFTGITGGTNGRRLTLINTTSDPATLVNVSSSSSSTNRIVTGTGSDYTLAANATIDLVYDSTDQLWHIVGATAAAQPTGTSLQSIDGHDVTRVGDGGDSGDPTLFTVDKATSAPTITDDALLGSMYYDTTLGKVQCYEAEGWGNCSAAPDTFVTISPEYSNAVMHGSDPGTISSDLCSDTLNINDGSSSQPTICGTNETHNFYKWTSSDTSAQTKSIFVTYKLPSNYKEFVAGTTSLAARTDSTNSSVTYQIYRKNGSGLTACGSAVSASTGPQTTWQTAAASGGADPSACGFTAGESIVFRIDLNAEDNANAYVSDLGFTFSNN